MSVIPVTITCISWQKPDCSKTRLQIGVLPLRATELQEDFFTYEHVYEGMQAHPYHQY